MATASQEHERAYLERLHALQLLKRNLPKVRDEFVVEVASMSREDLQKRVLIGSDWMGHFHCALDGIPEIRCIPGAGIDGCRDQEHVRAIVETLLRVSPMTWEKDCFGQPKTIPPAPSLHVVRAAIQDERGGIHSVPKPGRHPDVIGLMVAAGFPKPIPNKNQGFLLSDGQFVNRHIAARVAIQAGQCAKVNFSTGLMTEDVW